MSPKTTALILMAALSSGCQHDPFAVCKATAPSSYACTAYDGGVSEFLSVSVLTTDLEDGYFPSTPTCLFSSDGGAGAVSFDQPFCRSTPGDASGEDLRHVNVRCAVPEGRWTLTDANGATMIVEQTDAGLVCTR